MQKVLYVTGNQNKADYLAKLLGMPLDHKKIDIDEIQSPNPQIVIEHKVRQAYERVQQPVLVEDISFGFMALNGLPGPFIKYFVEQENGLENLCRMLDGFDTREAKGECIFGYYDGTNYTYFHGEIAGTIAEHPRGKKGFGWDKIFCPDGFGGKTSSELTEVQYSEYYLRIKPIKAVREFLQKLRETQQ